MARPVVVVVGPSGTGKSSALRQLAADGIVRLNPTWTTRQPRHDEQNGHEHWFVSEQDFAQLEQDGFFLETAQMFGLPYKYGLPAIAPADDDRVPVVVLRAALVPLFKRYYPSSIVYHIEDELNRVRDRIKAREAMGEASGSRLDDYMADVRVGRRIADRTFVNSSIPALVRQLRRAIQQDCAKS